MTGVDHRAPGVAVAALLDDDAYVELIADGIHVDPALWPLITAAQAVRTGCCSSATRFRSPGRATAQGRSAASRSRSVTAG